MELLWQLKTLLKNIKIWLRKNLMVKDPPEFSLNDNNDVEDIIDLDDIASLKPSKNAQIAAKKIN